MISRDTIDEVRSRIDIVDVIGDFVNLKRSGNTYKALSPFTNEKTPSFYVVPSKGIFKDFSSGKGGDAITFVREHEGMSYAEAIRFLAKKYGVEIKEEAGAMAEDHTERDSLYILMGYARDYYMDLLHKHEEGVSIGKSYFRERGFTDAIIKQFELGYSLDEWDALTKAAIKNGYRAELLEKTGLSIRKEGGGLYDRFRGRIIFPVHNLSGKVIAFGARILTKDKKQPKYVNSPETEIYHKGSVLYGMFQARNAIRKEDSCFLVEGYTDVLSLWQAGVENVVASSGTALTEEQIKLIRRFTEHVTVLFDGDQAGINAALRGVDLLLKGGLNVRVVALPDGEDPDSLARKLPAAELREYLATHAKDFLIFKMELSAAEAAKDPIRKAELIREIVTSIALIPDPLKRSVYIQQCSSSLDVPPEVLSIEIKKIVLDKRRNETKTEDSELLKTKLDELHTLSKTFLPSPEEALKEYERELVKVLLMIGHEKMPEGFHVYDVIFTETDDVSYIDPRHQEIIDLYRSTVASGLPVSPDAFIKTLPETLRNYVADFVVQKYEVSDGWKKHKIYIQNEYVPDVAPYKAIRRLKLGLVQKMLHENKEKLKVCKDPKEEESLLEIQFGIDQIKNALGSELSIHVFPGTKLLNTH